MKTLAILLLTGWPVLLAAADEPPALANNPFSRPPSDVIRDLGNAFGRDEAIGAELVVHATMIGSINRLANVDGRILKPGDEILGHELIEVSERYAVFERDGRSITVYVKPDMAENDE